ncbi:hypothetical protein VTG60DRAFT_3616 [Thermothelomyces hinnuleus]
MAERSRARGTRRCRRTPGCCRSPPRARHPSTPADPAPPDHARPGGPTAAAAAAAAAAAPRLLLLPPAARDPPADLPPRPHRPRDPPGHAVHGGRYDHAPLHSRRLAVAPRPPLALARLHLPPPPSRHPLADRCTWGGGPPTACHLYRSTRALQHEQHQKYQKREGEEQDEGEGDEEGEEDEDDSECRVGREVLGLLRACRLTYRECVGLVYGENVVHVGSGALLLHTEALLPRERAASVRALVVRVAEEAAWDYADEHLGLRPGLDAYHAMLGRLPRAFPGLRALTVALHGSLRRGRVRWRQGERDPLDPAQVRHCLLETMDAVVRGYNNSNNNNNNNNNNHAGAPALAECVLALAHDAFDRVMGGDRAAADKVQESKEGSSSSAWVQFWRPVTVAPGALGGEATLETGYWVRRVSPWEANDDGLGAGLSLSL